MLKVSTAVGAATATLGPAACDAAAAWAAIVGEAASSRPAARAVPVSHLLTVRNSTCLPVRHAEAYANPWRRRPGSRRPLPWQHCSVLHSPFSGETTPRSLRRTAQKGRAGYHDHLLEMRQARASLGMPA